MIDITQVLDGTPPNTGAALTVSRPSTNVLDMLIGRDIGADEFLGINVRVITAFTAGGAATLRCAWEVSADNVTFYSIAESPLIPVAQLVAGASIMRYAVPRNQILNAVAGVLNFPGRYYRLAYTVATGPMLTGTIFAFINPRPDRNTFYAPAINYTAYVDPDEI